jgi:transposase
MRYIGIDVSKATFMVAYPLNEKEYRTREFKNTTKGIHEFIRTLEADDHCVMEATGNYSYLLLYLLNQANITTSMENALKVKNFARTMLSVTKTDKADAQLLSLYGERMRPTPFKLPSDSILLLKQKRTAMRQFQKQLHSMTNLKKSLEVLPQKDPATFKSINKIIETLEKQIRKIEEDLIALTHKEFERQMQKLTSIKGIGASLAAAIIISTGGFTYFDNAKQVSRYLGICPTYQQSGTSINVKGHINRNGDSYLRSQLYVASWSMSQHNKECHNLYLRMKEKGKPGKLIMIAVANKVIRQCFAVVKHDTDYVDGFVSQKPQSFNLG